MPLHLVKSPIVKLTIRAGDLPLWRGAVPNDGESNCAGGRHLPPGPARRRREHARAVAVASVSFQAGSCRAAVAGGGEVAGGAAVALHPTQPNPSFRPSSHCTKRPLV